MYQDYYRRPRPNKHPWTHEEVGEFVGSSVRRENTTAGPENNGIGDPLQQKQSEYTRWW